MLSSRHQLYIGLNGLAGSGKDTVAKMMNIILSRHWSSKEQCWDYYNSHYSTEKVRYATYNSFEKINNDTRVICIAFADQLKYICSSMFGIPVDRFYHNKENAWICINNNFEYTEYKPAERIISADDYYYGNESYKSSGEKCWMTLRDALIYVGTYLCQTSINKNIFVNGIRNNLKEIVFKNENLQYIILTDVRFSHELDYIKKESSGINIKIVRDSIEQMENIAEHELDFEESFDYYIYNNGTYEDLFTEVWNLIHDNTEFYNITIPVLTREDNARTYLRKVDENRYKLCTNNKLQKISRTNGYIESVDPIGGPYIEINTEIPGTTILVKSIELDEITGDIFINV